MGELPDSPRRLILWTIVVVAAALAVCWALYLVRHILLLIYVSALFAIGIAPLVRLIEKQKLLPIGTRRFPRWLAILTLYFVVIGTLTNIALMVVPPLIEQARDLWNRLPAMFEGGQRFLIDRGILDRRFTLKEAVARAPGPGVDAVDTLVGAVWGVVGGLFGLLTILILTFYLLVEADAIFESFVRLFPRSKRPRVASVAREISVKVSAWLGGQLLLAGIIGASAAVGLALLRVPFFYVLALIAAVGEMIPIVGPLVAAVPAIAVALTVSWKLGVFVAIFFVVQQQVENHVLVPKLMERQVGISAVTVIIALLVGGSLLGVVGAILAIPTAAIFQVLLQELVAENGPRVGR